MLRVWDESYKRAGPESSTGFDASALALRDKHLVKALHTAYFTGIKKKKKKRMDQLYMLRTCKEMLLRYPPDKSAFFAPILFIIIYFFSFLVVGDLKTTVSSTITTLLVMYLVIGQNVVWLVNLRNKLQWRYYWLDIVFSNIIHR